MDYKKIEKNLYIACLVLTALTFVTFFTVSGLNLLEKEPYFLCEFGGKLIFCDIILTISLGIQRRKQNRISNALN